MSRLKSTAAVAASAAFLEGLGGRGGFDLLEPLGDIIRPSRRSSSFCHGIRGGTGSSPSLCRGGFVTVASSTGSVDEPATLSYCRVLLVRRSPPPRGAASSLLRRSRDEPRWWLLRSLLWPRRCGDD